MSKGEPGILEAVAADVDALHHHIEELKRERELTQGEILVLMTAQKSLFDTSLLLRVAATLS